MSDENMVIKMVFLKGTMKYGGYQKDLFCQNKITNEKWIKLSLLVRLFKDRHCCLIKVAP